MGVYLKEFENHTQYNSFIADTENFIKPNVSLCVQENEVHFNPYVEIETRLVAKYNVISTSEPTVLRTNYEQNIFKSMEIDGVMLDELVTEYTFDTIGEHTVKYELYDETKLGGYNAPVFYNNNLVECIIPNSVTSIGNLAFYECTSLTRLNSDADGVFNIPSGVTSISQAAFFKCYNLTSIDIPNTVTSIGDGAFQYCSNLTNIVIPDSVTTIGDGAFQNCSGITSCIIGSGVTSIGQYAFFDCSGLTNITSNRTTAPTIDSTTFQGVKTGGTLTVPNGSTGYDTWMSTGDYYLGKYNWTKVEQ